MTKREALWGGVGLREAGNSDLEGCKESLKCFYLSSLPLSVCLIHCSLFLLTCCLLHLKILSTKWPTTASKKGRISPSPCFPVSPLILIPGKRFLSVLLVQLTVSGVGE